MSEQAAEFDTVAAWTAEAALALGPDFFVPAGCRGSGSPAELRWFVDRLALTASDRMLDCGAGVGGPAAFAVAEAGARPVLTDPQAGACRAAQALFGLPVVQAASPLPFASGSFDVAWSLGVLCTVPDQPQFLSELRRVLTPTGRLGLLVFTAQRTPLPDQPVGNHFPTEAELGSLMTGAGFTVQNSASAGDFPAGSAEWGERVDAVTDEVERRHGDEPAWRTAAEQGRLIGRLLARGDLVGSMVVARPR